jgi:hypothetical protein
MLHDNSVVTPLLAIANMLQTCCYQNPRSILLTTEPKTQKAEVDRGKGLFEACPEEDRRDILSQISTSLGLKEFS